MSDAQPPKKATNYGNLPSNSKKSADKADRPTKPKEITPITSGTVVQRKKPLGKRIAESFQGDDTRSVGSYILFEVVLPAAKDLIVDTATQAIQRMMYGGDVRPGSGARRGYTPYNKYGSGVTGSRPNISTMSQRPNPRAVHDFSDLVMDNRAAADDVIDSLNEIIMAYDIATVADLYELVGITGSYTDDKWGWSNMAGARVVRVKDGYRIDLPRTISLDQLD
jgi:hypothetical protein